MEMSISIINTIMMMIVANEDVQDGQLFKCGGLTHWFLMWFYISIKAFQNNTILWETNHMHLVFL